MYFQSHKTPGSLTDSPFLNRNMPHRSSMIPSSPVTSRASTTSPLASRRFLHYQNPPPNVLSSLQQILHQYPPQHNSIIKEEDEPRSISISEASVTTTIERVSSGVSTSATTTPNSSKLPKFSPQLDRAKKTGVSWLNKLRLNYKKPNN